MGIFQFIQHELKVLALFVICRLTDDKDMIGLAKQFTRNTRVWMENIKRVTEGQSPGCGNGRGPTQREVVVDQLVVGEVDDTPLCKSEIEDMGLPPVEV